MIDLATRRREARAGPSPPALLALLEGGARPAILVIVAYSVINMVIQSLIQPKFVGDTVGLSATLTFLSLVSYVLRTRTTRSAACGTAEPVHQGPAR